MSDFEIIVSGSMIGGTVFLFLVYQFLGQHEKSSQQSHQQHEEYSVYDLTLNGTQIIFLRVLGWGIFLVAAYPILDVFLLSPKTTK